jgi:hypothetical protein
MKKTIHLRQIAFQNSAFDSVALSPGSMEDASFQRLSLFKEWI